MFTFVLHVDSTCGYLHESYILILVTVCVWMGQCYLFNYLHPLCCLDVQQKLNQLFVYDRSSAVDTDSASLTPRTLDPHLQPKQLDEASALW